jgi:predicted ATPase
VQSPYIEQMTVRNVACLKDVTFELTRLHAFVGPNDSGKSTLLRTISYAAEKGRPTRLPTASQHPGAIGEISFVAEGQTHHVSKRQTTSLNGAQTLRLEADALRDAAPLIPATSPIALATPRGHGLVSVCDAIYSRDVEHWLAIRKRFVELFPTARSLELSNASAQQKELAILLQDGTRITAQQMSEGMLYWLAFATLQYAQRPSVYLVEEPENGLHPARIKEVVAILRDVSKTAQVVMATHSPLVINELEPEEVSIVTRPPDTGTKVTRMTATPNFDKRKAVYALGELWLSYADGELESELTSPTEVAG